MIYIIIIALILTGVFILKKSYKYDTIGIVLVVVFSIFLLFVTIGDINKGYEYENFTRKREAFEKTLNNSRKSKNPYESAAIVKEVAEWNEELAHFKYLNTTIVSRFTDDRFNDLKPIK